MKVLRPRSGLKTHHSNFSFITPFMVTLYPAALQITLRTV